MRIKAENTQELQEAIHTAEGQAKVRTITPTNIQNMLKLVDDRLHLVSTKTAAVGTTVHVDYNAQSFPNAYKYRPMSTHFTAKLTAKGWVVTDIFRSQCWSQSHRIAIQYTEDTLARMKEKLETVY